MLLDFLIIKKVDNFVKKAFIENPHYSFNHWSVMYNHSVKVKDLALKVARGQKCDKVVLAVGALLHDIGKTYHADATTLHKDHEKLNIIVAKDFLDNLKITKEQREKIFDVIKGGSDLVEGKIVRDADGLAFYLDRNLYMLWIEWATKNNISENDKIRKIEKYSYFNFPVSQKIGKSSWEQMKKDWQPYLN